MRPSNQLSAYTSQHIPGVTLTTCNFDSNYDPTIWPGSHRIGSPRCWPQDSSDHSDQSGHRDSDHSVYSGEHRDSGKIRHELLSHEIHEKKKFVANFIDNFIMISLQNRAVPVAARIAFIRIAIIKKSKLVSAIINIAFEIFRYRAAVYLCRVSLTIKFKRDYGTRWIQSISLKVQWTHYRLVRVVHRPTPASRRIADRARKVRVAG